MTSPAIAAQATVLAYSDGGSPSSFTNVPGVNSIRGLGGGATPVNDTSDLDSLAKEKLPGLIDEGSIAVSININMNNSVHAALNTARRNKTRLEWKVTYSNSKIDQFFGYVLTFGRDINTGDAVRGQMTIEVDGLMSNA